MILLKNIGCDVIQGYYYSKPLMDVDASEVLLSQGK
jgi:EAL domain-containing protein (putative c-di-GMP-specific phosphodiesterase class I)